MFWYLGKIIIIVIVASLGRILLETFLPCPRLNESPVNGEMLRGEKVPRAPVIIRLHAEPGGLLLVVAAIAGGGRVELLDPNRGLLLAASPIDTSMAVPVGFLPRSRKGYRLRPGADKLPRIEIVDYTVRAVAAAPAARQ